MYCTRCGKELQASANFCSNCGYQVKQSFASGNLAAPKRLFRLTRDKKLAGVCAGLARYLNVDVTLVRLITVTVVVLTGFVLGIVYLVAWIIMPVETDVLPASAPVPAEAQQAAPNNA